MSIINDFFDKVFVISLRDSERRTFITNTFKKLGIKFEFFDAVRGSELSQTTISKIYDKEAAAKHKTSSRSLTKSELGCALSHLNIYRLMEEENYDNALIFEDDAMPVKYSIGKVENILKELPEDWELIYFGVNGKVKAPFSFNLKLLFYYPFTNLLFGKNRGWKYKELWRLYPKNYSKHLKIAGYHQGAHAYGVTQKGAEKLIENNQKITATFDALLGQAIVERVIKGYLVKNNLFRQNKSFDSQIDSTWIERNREIEQNMFAKIKNKYLK